MDLQRLLSQMTLDEKVGQLFLLAFASDRMDEARTLFQEHYVGASYISNDNVPTPAAAIRLTAEIQGYAAATRLKIPLLLGADQEGSWSVMTPGSCTGPGNFALGATGDPQAAYRMYQVIGEELAAVGLNLVLAPCIDCNSNPQNSIIGMRSFGEFPDLVGRMGAAAFHGAHAGGVAVSIKHFPGHGDTRTDSHRGLPTVDRSYDELIRIDLHPFMEGIRAGADMVMTAHIIFTALDPDQPATLSSKILQDFLRGKLGFDGVVLSDSMNMRAMKRNFDPHDSAVRAINAGVDMIMLAEEHYDHDSARYLAQQTALLDAVKGAVRSGQISAGRLDEAVLRVLTLKANRGLFNDGPHPAPLSVVGSEAHRAVERDVSRQAVAVLRDRGHLVPLGREKRVLLVNTTRRSGYTALNATRGIGPNPGRPAFDYFADAMRSRYPNLRIISAEEALEERFAPDPDETIVAVTENYPLPGMDFDMATQRQLIPRLHARFGDRLIVVALRDPYELAGFPEIGTYLCAFSFRPCAADAAADVLSGAVEAVGRSPVSV